MSEVKDPTAPLEEGESESTSVEGDITYPGYRPAGRKFLRFPRVPRPNVTSQEPLDVIPFPDAQARKMRVLKKNPSGGAA
jgi:hypothetical protein